jgi:uncharacterized protein YdhG (YjbR/CyaY superfamily)
MNLFEKPDNKYMDEIEKYLKQFPENVQNILNTIRKLVKEIVPEAAESMAYGMPAYKTFGKPLVYFAGYKNHIGFYATPTGHQEFAKELSKYKQGKGSVQFPIDKPIPYDLIRQIIEFRMMENELNFKKETKRIN